MINKVRADQIARIILFLTLLSFSCLYIYLALICRWASSEVWPLGASRKLFLGQPEYAFYIKPVFNFLLFLINKVADFFGSSPIDMARVFFALNLTAIVILFCRAISYVLPKKNRGLILLFLVLLCSNTYIISRGFRIRSDLLALTLYMILLNLHISPRNWFQRYFLEIFLGVAVLGFFITPKSLYFAVIFVPFFYKKMLVEREKRNGKKMLYIASGVTGFAYVLWGLFYREVPLWATIKTLYTYMINSFYYHETGVAYFSRASFNYLEKMATENFFMVSLFLAGLYLSAQNMILRQQRHLSLAFILWLMLLIFHPNKFPFFIASMLPIGLFLTISLLRDTLESKFFLWVTFLGVLVSFYGSADKVRFIRLAHTNAEQKKVISYLNKEIPKHNVRLVYDPAAIYYGKNVEYWFLGPSQSKDNYYSFLNMRTRKPDIVLMSLRFLHFKGLFSAELKENYFCHPSGICIRTQKYSLDRNCRSDFFKQEEKLKPPFLHQVFMINSEKGTFSDITELNQKQVAEACPGWAGFLKLVPFRISPVPFRDNMKNIFRFDFEI